MKKIAFILIFMLFIILGCKKAVYDPSDCSDSEFFNERKQQCIKIINECQVDGDCPGLETCETKILTEIAYACKVGEPCPESPSKTKKVCKLTEDSKIYCEKDSDCVWAIDTGACCSCPEVTGRRFLESEKDLEIYEEDKDYSSFGKRIKCGRISCEGCAPLSENSENLKCVSDTCISGDIDFFIKNLQKDDSSDINPKSILLNENKEVLFGIGFRNYDEIIDFHKLNINCGEKIIFGYTGRYMRSGVYLFPVKPDLKNVEPGSYDCTFNLKDKTRAFSVIIE